MRSRRIVFAGAVTLVCLFVPPSAMAQAPEATDPTPGSPSGTIYHLPVDTGRSDAAPRPPGSGGGTNPDDEGTPGALYRSDNNFGTSSQVPGAPPGSGGGNGSAGGGTGGGGNGDSGGGGSGTQGAVAASSDNGAVSEPLAFGLLALLLAAGGALGLALIRARPGANA